MSEPKKIDDGGSAFPSCGSQGNGPGGMTLRDYFAAKALQALVAHANINKVEEDVQIAYEYADAMIAAGK